MNDLFSGAILKIPNSVVVPYNAQATLHFYDAFWALLLPVTVAGRVSDIWRSYIGQALFKRLDLSLGFLPRPLVVQERNMVRDPKFLIISIMRMISFYFSMFSAFL